MSYETDMTIEYYNQNADAYVKDTLGADMSATREKFLRYIPVGGMILDFGCGSGRDAKAFADAGYNVVALDGSQELCNKALEVLKKPVIVCKFQDYRAMTKFNGIWACATLLHLPTEELKPVLNELVASLKTAGILYMSFKCGDYSGERGGKWYTDMTEEKISVLLSDYPELQIDLWRSSDVRNNVYDTWLNVLCKKEG